MPANVNKKLQALIISGQLSREHDPRLNQWLRRMLESTGIFQVKITEEFRGATAETLAPYDLAIVNYDGNFPSADGSSVPMGERAEQALVDFVESGKGVFFYHSSIWVTPWTEKVLRLMGGHTDPNQGSRKNPKLEFPVKIANHSHPVIAGLQPAFNAVTDDFFVGVIWHPEAKIEVLATVYDGVEDYKNIPPHFGDLFKGIDFANLKGINQDHAVAWTNQCGKGRVFTLTIGHGIDTLRRPAFVAFVCRAAEWAATGNVTLAPPDLTMLNRLRAWPYYSEMTVVEYGSIVS